jgi:dolichol-phosphate mannosyltransferase
VPDEFPIPSALVVIPTYNEAESLPPLLSTLLALDARFDILVVDDSSPDGTGAVADAAAAAEPRVHVLHRQAKDGLGRAYLSGFEWALARGYAAIVEMDADGSHPAETLPTLIDGVLRGGADLVVGSRWMPGGRVVDWSRSRQVLSRGGNTYARMILGIPVRDCTSGFRAYSGRLLGRLHFADVHSHGYCFQIEMTLRSIDEGAVLREIPITFRDRELGESKMSRGIVAEAMLRVTWWGLLRRLRALHPRERGESSRARRF